MNLCTFLLLALAFSALQFSSALTPTIDFVSLNSASQSTSTRVSSLLGGATLYIRGSGLSSDPSATEVTIGSTSCPIQSSLTSSFQIACTVPAASSSGIVAITITINGIAANCQTDICIFNYTSSATPILEFIVPTAVVPNSNLYFQAIPRVSSTSSLTLNFNSTYCDFSAFSTQALSPDELQFIECRIGPIAVGYYTAQLTAVSQGLGYIGFPGYGGFISPNNPYNLVVVPQITQVSVNSGPTSGSILTITGAGFSTSPEQNIVKYGNNSCYILTSAYTYLQCILSLPVAPSIGSLTPGHSGWTVTTYSSKFTLDQLLNATNSSAIQQQKIMSAELPYDNFTGVSEVIEGFFKPPVNGSYRFYLSSQGASQLYISRSPLSKATLSLIAEIKNGSEFRNFYNPYESSQISDPIYLREGQYYYLKAVHVDAEDEHLTIGVKVPTTGRNILSPKKVISISIQAEVEREEVVFTLKNSASKVRILYISNGAILTSRNITFPSSSAQVVAALADIGLSSEVLSQTFTNSSGDIVTSSAQASQVQYRIRFLSDRTSSSLPGLSDTTLGNFAAAPGNNPTALVSGSYQLNVYGSTVTLQFNETAESMQTALDNAFGEILSTRVFVYGDCQEGCNYTVQFIGINASFPNITVASNSLAGGRTDPEVVIDLIQETSSIYTIYNPIPFDMLFTAETQPQITVNTSGILGSCSGNCSFSLYNTTDFPTVVGYTLTNTTLKVELTNAASYTAQQLRVYFSGSQGLVTGYNVTTQTITVTLATNSNKAPLIVAGVQYPIVGLPDNTLAGLDQSVAPMVVQPIIMTVQAIRSGNNLIFAVTGTGFGISLSRTFGTTATIGGVTCTIQVLSNTQLRCIATITSTAGPLVITVNGITARFPFVFGDPDIITSVGVYYDSTDDYNILDIKGTGFGSNTTAIILNNDNGETDNCRVCDKSSTELECSLRGLEPGNYTVFLTSFQSPNTLLRSNRTFTIPFAIYDVSPKAGSELGGTVLTITGKGFSPILNQNQVSIGSQNIRCDVIEANATVIQCMTKPNLIQYSSPEMVTAWYRLEFESQCLGECFFDYDESATPAITNVSPVTIQAGQNLTLEGRNFTKNAEITIGNLTADILWVNSTQMIVKVPDVSASSNLGLEATDPTLGDYRIASTVTLNSSLQLVSISPLSGSVAGTIITLEGYGFSSSAEVKVGGEVCEILSQTTQEIICKTAPQSTGYVSVTQGSFNAITCSDCYHTSLNSLTPIVSDIQGLSDIAGTDMNIVITGKLLNLVNDISVVLESDSSSLQAALTSASETSISATFAKPFAGEYTLEVKLGNYYAEFSRSISNQVTLSFPVSSDVPETDISIGGGLPITIQTAGIPDNTSLISINIAGLDCDITSVTSSSITCTIPALVTALTQNLYQIAEEDVILTGTYFASNAKENASLVFDNNTASYFISYTAECYFGIDVGDGLVAQISGIEYFPQYNVDESKIQGAVFEGSNDGTTYTLISKIDENVYEGINRIVFSGEEAKPTYRFIRYRKASSTSSCQIAEMRVRGTIVSSLDVQDVTLVSIPNATVSMNGITQQVPVNINYKLSSTPIVAGITPNLGTSVGGTVVTITGENFSDNISDVQVTIDNTVCAVTQATATQITCTTGALPAVADRTERLTGAVEVFIAGKGSGLAPGVTFLYAERWSDTATWGCDGLPVDGDSVQVPIGMNLLVDVSTPSLVAVVVEGGLYFEDTDLEFTAEYIMVRNGILQIGTEEAPIQSEITITLTGNRSSATLPIFGDKVIGLYEGSIDIHGKPRSMVSTFLRETAQAGQTYVVLEDIGDLTVGDEIVIGTTSTDYTQNEKVTVTSVDAQNNVVNFDNALKYVHLAETTSLGDFAVKAMVIVLTRNIVIKGDDDVSDSDKYGAQMLFYDPGTEATVVRMSYVEIMQAGQAGLDERYPINFQNTGGQVNSYIKGVSIHDTYNMGLNVRGADYLTIQGNVFYNIEGTGIGLSDGVERFNTIEDNTVIGVFSNLFEYNADLSPAAILITNPLNYLRRNKAAGVVRTAFKLNYLTNARGAFASTSICPQGERLGAFEDNMAVSCGSYCLLSASHFPRTYACKSAFSTSGKNPLANNPPVTAVYKNFSAARSQDAAIGAQDLGSVIFEGFRTGDNVRAGIEIKGTGSFLNASIVTGAVLYGQLGLSDGGVSGSGNYVGLIVPNAEGFRVENSSFINFEAGQAAISSPDCGIDASARTTFMTGLGFVNVVTRIGFITPYTHIFKDTDGSLTDLVEGGTVVYNFPHLDDPQCATNDYMQDGLVCDSSVQIKRVLLYGSIGSTTAVYYRSMKIMQLEGSETSVTGASVIKPMSGAWGAPFITGKAYQIFIGDYDWSQLKIQPSLYYQVADLPISFVFNYTQYREDYDVLRKVYLQSAQNLTNSTTLWDIYNPELGVPELGQFYNDVANKKLYVGVGRIESQDPVTYQEAQNLQISAFACKLNCPKPVTDGGSGDEIDNIYYWSVAESWPSGKIPQDGESVTIPSDTRVILDVNTAQLELLEIQGELEFDTSERNDPLTLTAKKIWVRGKLYAGSEDEPYTNNATIQLIGSEQDSTLVVNFAVDAGTKVIAVTGSLELYGQKAETILRLAESALPDGSTIVVDGDLSAIKPGDELYIAASRNQISESEIVTVKSIDGNVITLAAALDYFHYGSSEIQNTSVRDVDMRTEVVHLNRNIRIVGQNNGDGLGAKIVVTEEFGETDTQTGSVKLQYTAIESGGNQDTALGALNFEVANNGDETNVIKGVVIRDSLSYGVSFQQAKNVEITQSAIINVQQHGIIFSSNNQNINIEENIIANVNAESSNSNLKISTISAGISLIDNSNSEITILSNIATSCEQACYLIIPPTCVESNFFLNNIAHSSKVGYLAYTSTSDCFSLSDFVAYKTSLGVAAYSRPLEIHATSLVLADNSYGLHIDTSLEEGSKIQISDSFFATVIQSGCKNCYKTADDCSNQRGLILEATDEILALIPEDTNYALDGSNDFLSSVQFLSNNTFVNFQDDVLQSCINNFIITPNLISSDYAPYIKIDESTLVNVSQSSLAAFPTSIIENSQYCDDLSCTNRFNILIKDDDGSFIGNGAAGTLLPNNPEVVDPAVCSFNTGMNGYICSSSGFAALTFEDLDKDACGTLLSPVKVTDNADFTNGVNSYKKYISSDEQSCSAPRFTSIIQTNNAYTLEFTEYKPTNISFQLMGDDTDAATITITYKKPQVILVSDSNTQRTIDSIVKSPGETVEITSSDSCGTNILDSTRGIISFKVTGESRCKLLIQQANSLLFTIRFDIDVNEFFLQGGVAPFIDKVASVLGIASKNIRIVGIYSGSTILQTAILSSAQGKENVTAAEAELNGYAKKLAAAAANNELMMYNATILNYSNQLLLIDRDNSSVVETITSSGHGALFYFAVIGLPILAFGALVFAIYQYKKAQRRARMVTRVAPEDKLQEKVLEKRQSSLKTLDPPTTTNVNTTEQVVVSSLDDLKEESVVTMKNMPESTERHDETTGRQDETIKELTRDIAGLSQKELIKRRQERYRRRFESPNGSLGSFGGLVTPDGSFSKKKLLTPKQIEVKPKEKLEIEDYVENKLKNDLMQSEVKKKKRSKRRTIVENLDEH